MNDYARLVLTEIGTPCSEFPDTGNGYLQGMPWLQSGSYLVSGCLVCPAQHRSAPLTIPTPLPAQQGR